MKRSVKIIFFVVFCIVLIALLTLVNPVDVRAVMTFEGFAIIGVYILLFRKKGEPTNNESKEVDLNILSYF